MARFFLLGMSVVGPLEKRGEKKAMSLGHTKTVTAKVRH